jgi:hypothetical protein
VFAWFKRGSLKPLASPVFSNSVSARIACSITSHHDRLTPMSNRHLGSSPRNSASSPVTLGIQ